MKKLLSRVTGDKMWNMKKLFQKQGEYDAYDLYIIHILFSHFHKFFVVVHA